MEEVSLSRTLFYLFIFCIIDATDALLSIFVDCITRRNPYFMTWLKQHVKNI